MLPVLSVADADALFFSDLVIAGLGADWAPLDDARKQALLNLGSRFIDDHFVWSFETSATGTTGEGGSVPEGVQRAQCLAALHALRGRILVDPQPQTTSIRAGRFGKTSSTLRRATVPADIVAAVGTCGRLRRSTPSRVRIP